MGASSQCEDGSGQEPRERAREVRIDQDNSDGHIYLHRHPDHTLVEKMLGPRSGTHLKGGGVSDICWT